MQGIVIDQTRRPGGGALACIQVVNGRGPAAAPPPARRALAPDLARARAPRPASLTLSPGWIQGQGPGPAGATTAPMRLGDSEFPDQATMEDTEFQVSNIVQNNTK
jgi:hypothetical protein